MKYCDYVAMFQVQVVENNLDVPKGANEEPCDVNYPFPFSISFGTVAG